MNHWYLVLIAILFTQRASFALDYSLTEPAVASVSYQDQLTEVKRQPTSPRPDLPEGTTWLCSVGQKPEINSAAYKQALKHGWGFWQFPAHAKCPAGVYHSVVVNGHLKPTGTYPWLAEPTTAAPPVRYASSSSPSAYYCSDGSCYGCESSPVASTSYGGVWSGQSVCSNGSCGVSYGSNSGSTGYRYSAPSYRSGGIGSFGGRLFSGIFRGGCSSGGCATCR